MPPLLAASAPPMGAGHEAAPQGLTRNAGDGPVFVVGMNGSGTTMLADSLGKHPGLYMHRFEVKVLPFYLQRLNRYGDLDTLECRRRLARDIGKAKALWQFNGMRDLVVPDDRLTQPGFAGVVGSIFEELASRHGKARWGEKSPMNLIHIAALAQAFPDARFVHILRDGRESAQSFHRRYGYEPRHTIYRWKRAITIGRNQGRQIGPARYTEVRYEQLTANPESEMRRVCSFLGLPFTEHVIESSMRMIDADVARGHSGIIENSDKWRTYFTAQQIAELEQIAGRCLAENGYEVTDPEGDVDPSAYSMRWWSLRDQTAEAIRFIKQWRWKGVPALLKIMLAAVKQARAGKI